MALIKDNWSPPISQKQRSILCPHLYLPAAFGTSDHPCLSEILSSLGLQKPIAPLFPPIPLTIHSQSLLLAPPPLSHLQMLTCLGHWSGPLLSLISFLEAPHPVPCFECHLDADITKFNFAVLTSSLRLKVIYQIAYLTYPHKYHIDSSKLIWAQWKLTLSYCEPCVFKILSHWFCVTGNYYSPFLAILEVLQIHLRMWSSSQNTTHSWLFPTLKKYVVASYVPVTFPGTGKTPETRRKPWLLQSLHAGRAVEVWWGADWVPPENSRMYSSQALIGRRGEVDDIAFKIFA